MKESSKEQLVEYIEKASITIIALLFIVFPLTFSNITTDLFVLPKQILLSFITLSLLVLYGIKTLLNQSLRIKRTPLDLPIIIFGVAVFISVVFSVAKFDSLYNFVPFLFSVIMFFAITYNTRNQKSLNVLVGSLLLGGALSSIFALLSFLKVYPFPIDFTKTQTFTPLGSILDQVLYLGLLLPLGLTFALPNLRKGRAAIFTANKENNIKLLTLGILTIVNLVGFAISIYSLIYLQKGLILPLATGFQIAFAAISQDGPRIIQGFLFGSGFGEFSLAFLRFKQALFNANTSIWNLTFFRSSTFVLELLTTTGVAGLASFLYIVYKAVRQKPLFLPLVVFVIASFVLPLAFYHLTLFFFVLGIFAVHKSLSNHNEYFDVELQLVAAKKGFFVLSTEEATGRQAEKYAKILTSIVFGLILIVVLGLGFITYDFAINNINFQKSIVAASQNNGSLTYTYQANALNSITGKYTDAYYRVYSQTNLALANALANSNQGKTPSQQTTQTIYTLVQQSINSARTATTLSPSNALNWQNLSGIYRSLIGFGQNADSFAILAAQQSIQLDPTNPQEYINLGGIYYQLKNWDKAIEQFQLAINLKPDLPNAYYNHAHALIEKGDLNAALTELETVKQLVKNDPTNSQKIDTEIADLNARIKGNGSSTSQEKSTLDANQPSSSLPKQNPQVKIPGPSATLTPTPTQNPNPSASPTSFPTQ